MSVLGKQGPKSTVAAESLRLNKLDAILDCYNLRGIVVVFCIQTLLVKAKARRIATDAMGKPAAARA